MMLPLVSYYGHRIINLNKFLLVNIWSNSMDVTMYSLWFKITLIVIFWLVQTYLKKMVNVNCSDLKWKREKVIARILVLFPIMDFEYFTMSVITLRRHPLSTKGCHFILTLLGILIVNDYWILSNTFFCSYWNDLTIFLL